MNIRRFDDLYKANENNTLLTGNGFNIRFGYSSSYKYIFQEMYAKDSTCYDQEFINKVINNQYDLEKLLNEYPSLLAQKSIKMDFIKVLINAVRHAEKGKEKAAEFIRNFSKVFTLSYDPFLYKIGLYLNKQMNQGSSEYKEQLREIKADLEDLAFPNDKSFDDFNNTEKATVMAACSNHQKKTEFRKEAFTYLSQSNGPTEDSWKMRDGFRRKGEDKELLWELSDHQNIFYLHGALHIYKDSEDIKKISVGRRDTLMSRIMDRMDRNLTLDCILSSGNKISEIEGNPYMRDGLKKLGKISGNIFLYGVGLNENDHHIWSKIANNEAIKKVYISVLIEEDKQQGGNYLDANQTWERANELFGQKDIALFDSKLSDRLKIKETMIRKKITQPK